MPELPEVETIARDLRGLVAGATILGATCNWPRTLRSHEPEAFTAAVAGRTIEGVGRRGKQLLVFLGPRPGAVSRAGVGAMPEVTDGPDAGPAVMTVHLKMTGQLFVVPAATPSDRHLHLVLQLADGRQIRFRDIRKFGRIGLYRRDPATGLPLPGEAAGVLGRGLEPLADDLSGRKFAEVISSRRGRLKTLLLNQDFLAGVGNIYADEALWLARLHPLRDAHSIGSREAVRLHAALRDVLAEAVERRGSSIDDYTAPDGDGSMQEHLRVYQRAGEPCPRCGRAIQRIALGGRSTHFCSWCQRLPASQRRAAAAVLAAGREASRPGLGPRVGTGMKRGPRWTELPGEGALGRTAAEESAAGTRRRRVEALRREAATRRAAARAGVGDVTEGAAPTKTSATAPDTAGETA
jgi:formamidopyrimidine-DNA glycosylase